MEEMSEIASGRVLTDWRSPTRRQIGSCAKGSQSSIAPKATPFSRFRCGWRRTRDQDRASHSVSRRGERPIFSRLRALGAFWPVTSPDAPPVEMVRSLFDLTPTEASIARFLARGMRVNDIASSRGVSISTVRTHVRALLEKTGCNRQVDVLTLMAGLAPVYQRPQ